MRCRVLELPGVQVFSIVDEKRTLLETGQLVVLSSEVNGQEGA